MGNCMSTNGLEDEMVALPRFLVEEMERTVDRGREEVRGLKQQLETTENEMARTLGREREEIRRLKHQLDQKEEELQATKRSRDKLYEWGRSTRRLNHSLIAQRGAEFWDFQWYARMARHCEQMLVCTIEEEE